MAATVLWKDGRITVGWSNIDPAYLAQMVLMLDEDVRRKVLRQLK